jgi:hypothetical protein
MNLFKFEPVSVYAAGGEAAELGPAAGRQNAFGGGVAEQRAQAAFARQLTTRGQRAAAARARARR